MENEYDDDVKDIDNEEMQDMEEMGDEPDDLFYKATLKPNEPLIVSSPAMTDMPYFIKITGISFGLQVNKNSRTCVTVKDSEEDEEPGIVGVLTQGNQETIQCDILITGEQIFELKGTKVSSVFLTGNLVPQDDYIANDGMYGDDMDEDDIEQLMNMRKVQKRQRGEEPIFDNEDSTQIDEVEEEEEEVQEPPAKKQKTNDNKSIPTQKKPNQNNNNENKNNKKKNKKNKKNKNKNNNNNNTEPEQPKKKSPKQQPQQPKKKSPKQAPQQPKKKSPKQTPQEQPKQKSKKELVHIGQGLKFKKLKEGKGKVAKKGSQLKVYYVGQLQDKTIFDKCLSGEGFKFKMGEGSVISGWEKGCEGMKVGEKRRLIIPPKLAYGKEGSSPEIPSNATLTFTIELKSVN